MTFRTIDGINVWGDADEATLAQAKCIASHGDVAGVALMADNHKGYSQPIGGVVAYRNMVSPSGVGYDIGCGNKAVRTDLRASELSESSLRYIMDDIHRTISFGVGRKNAKPVDHALFDSPTWNDVLYLAPLKRLAHDQLGTVGSGNHYVDLFVDGSDGYVWVGVHFGSRGFGHKTASGFLNLAAGRKFDDKAPGESMDQPPTLLSLDSEVGQQYMAAMNLAGEYAYAGRDYVVGEVLRILGAQATFAVHNHHNFAWKETHNGEELIVVRKGATPNFPDQLGFVGGSMGDYSVILKGRSTDESASAFYSTVHGAGRVMSRTQAAGKMNWKTRQRSGGAISPEQMYEAVKAFGVELRGAGVDESPFVYRRLMDVLNAHSNTVEIVHVLKPIGVCMAGGDEFDPYKD